MVAVVVPAPWDAAEIAGAATVRIILVFSEQGHDRAAARAGEAGTQAARRRHTAAVGYCRKKVVVEYRCCRHLQITKCTRDVHIEAKAIAAAVFSRLRKMTL